MNNYSNSRQYHRRGGSERSDLATVVLFYVLPFIVVNAIIFFLVTTKPKCEISVGETSDYRTTTVTVRVKSFLPLKEPVAKLDDEAIELTKTKKNTYTAVLNRNGFLEIDLTSINKMSVTTFEQVNVLDDTPPTVSENTLSDDDILSFQLEDSQSGVDYSTIRGVDAGEQEVMPLKIDRSSGMVSFEMKTPTLQIYVKDLTGNELHATFDSTGNQQDILSEGENTSEQPAAQEPSSESPASEQQSQ